LTGAFGAWQVLDMSCGEVALEEYEPDHRDWAGEAVDPSWNGATGRVCVDVITETGDLKGYAGDVLRPLMRQDFTAHRNHCKNYWSTPLTPSSSFSYRRVPTVVEFLVSTGRWRPARQTFIITSWGGG
jgi:hypothetical protein